MDTVTLDQPAVAPGPKSVCCWRWLGPRSTGNRNRPSDPALICRVVARDTQHLQQLINELLSTPAIERCTSYIVLSRQVPPRTLPLVTSAATESS